MMDEIRYLGQQEEPQMDRGDILEAKENSASGSPSVLEVPSDSFKPPRIIIESKGPSVMLTGGESTIVVQADDEDVILRIIKRLRENLWTQENQ